MDNSYYTVEQISHMLDLHPKTVQRYIREGRLHAVKIGKAWRVSGHDLSVFLEQAGPSLSGAEKPAPVDVTVSAVADITVPTRDEAVRMMNALTGTLNGKPPEYGPSSLHVQHIPAEDKVRVTLWGTPRFMAAMMDCIAALTGNGNAGTFLGERSDT